MVERAKPGESDVRFIFRTSGVSDEVSFSRFKKLVEQKKRQMGGLADDWAAAQLVVGDLGAR